MSAADRKSPPTPPFAWQCPLPLQDYPRITLAHGGGGRLSAELVEHLFLPHFGNAWLAPLADAARFPAPGNRLSMTTDSFVVHPLFFPGGSVGELAVHGTVNDLAMSGARPLYLTAGFILEEGLPLETLARIVERMAQAAAAAGVAIVAGDTKVVEQGRGDGCYITTTGLGVVAPDCDVDPRHARPGDAILVSGPLGNHGIAVLSVREGLEFESPIVSDTAPLAELVAEMLAAVPTIRVLRDPTRGGLAATLNEIAARSGTGVVVEEPLIPVDPEVLAACEILGLDPLLVANEGKLVAVVPAERAELLLACMRRHPLGRHAAQVGTIVDDHPGQVVLATKLGARRLLPLPLGEQLPRIC